MIFILGPTASGKSALSMAIAQALGDQANGAKKVELISVDSAQVFQQMMIGTAKPSDEDLALVQHHLISIIDPTLVYSAQQFALDAKRLEAEIIQRGNLPICVGGTMLYVSAFTQGFDNLPQADVELRARLNALALETGWPHMHAQLALQDPTAAARIQPNDAQRIQRALEVIALTGRKISDQQTSQGLSLNRSGEHLVISLEPNDRLALHARIKTRLKAMYALGLVDEVRTLMTRPDLNSDMPSMRCVGYRQVWEAIVQSPSADNSSIEQQSFELALIATRQLAKRQLTWLRANPERTTFDCMHNTNDLLQPALTLIKNHV
jgi:tRNA dimethylallyltransferase